MSYCLSGSNAHQQRRKHPCELHDKHVVFVAIRYNTSARSAGIYSCRKWESASAQQNRLLSRRLQSSVCLPNFLTRTSYYSKMVQRFSPSSFLRLSLLCLLGKKETVFDCPFCGHEATCEVFIDRIALVGVRLQGICTIDTSSLATTF
jgi:hypothetical protein